MKRIKALSVLFVACVALLIPATAQAVSSYSIQDYPVDAYLTPDDLNAFSASKSYPLVNLSMYSVSYISLGSVCATQAVASGGLATKPANPTRSGYTFIGWYTSDTYETAWNFTTQKVTANTQIYAKWASDNSYLTTIKKSTGTWSRTMPFKKAGGSMRLNVSSSKSTLTLEPIKSSSKAKRYIKIGSGKYYRIAKVTMRVKKGSVKTVTMKVVSESGKTRYYKIYVTRR